MGRVNRYKKTKHLDPHGRDPDKLLHLDRPPSGVRDEQPIPRAAQHIVCQAKRTKDLQASRKRKQAKSSGRETFRKGKVKTQMKSTGQSCNSPSLERQVGESDKQYLKRLDIDAASLTLKAAKRLSKTGEKRRWYLQEKERKREQPNDSYVEPKWKDDVKFGEVVQAPPSLTAKPRKAAPTSHAPKLCSLQLTKQLADGKGHVAGGRSKRKSEPTEVTLPKAKRLRDMSQGERRQIEKARDEAIELYRRIKKQRQEEKT